RLGTFQRHESRATVAVLHLDNCMALQVPVRGTTLSAQVAEQVVSLITSGAWPVGTRIPPENTLVGRLGVSRNTIREALRSLVHSGMLEARPGDGTYVRTPSELQAPLV